jgi:hypothetical protein
MRSRGHDNEVDLGDICIETCVNPLIQFQETKAKVEELKQHQKLFKGLKFYLGREVPRENLVFMIRALGGQCHNAECATNVALIYLVLPTDWGPSDGNLK